jgi:biotin carboxyl carrier protein
MLYHVTIGSRTFRVELDGGRARIDDDDDFSAATLVALPGSPIRHLQADGRAAVLSARRGTDGTGGAGGAAGAAGTGAWELQLDGWPVHAHVVDERTRAIREMTGRSAAPAGPKPLRAPMPGLIVRVEVEAGAAVRAGQGVVVMEAMKMENELKADGDGVVARVLVEPGQAVEKGAVLVEFTAEPA